jgi:hypothetical protein
MFRKLLICGSLLALCALSGCSSKTETAPGRAVAPPPDPHERLIWSSSAERPAWTMEEPATKDGVLWFVGLSAKYSTEQQAREDARRNATASVVKYMGTLVKDQFERARVSYGLESDVVDPTASSREFEKQLAVNLATRVKMQTWYQEKWQTPTGVSNVAFVLANVPRESIDETYKSTARDMARNAERQAKETGDALARSQAEKAADFWKQMQEQGVTE